MLHGCCTAAARLLLHGCCTAAARLLRQESQASCSLTTAAGRALTCRCPYPRSLGRRHPGLTSLSLSSASISSSGFFALGGLAALQHLAISFADPLNMDAGCGRWAAPLVLAPLAVLPAMLPAVLLAMLLLLRLLGRARTGCCKGRRSSAADSLCCVPLSPAARRSLQKLTGLTRLALHMQSLRHDELLLAEYISALTQLQVGCHRLHAAWSWPAGRRRPLSP
jgi:hypothetical protein